MFSSKGPDRRRRTLGDLASRGWAAVALAALTALTFPGKAHAAPDLRTVLSTSAFAELVEELTTRLDTHYEIDDFGSNLYSCPLIGGTPSAQLREIVFDVDLRGFTLTPTDGKLTANFQLRVNGSADLEVNDLFCFGGSGSCDVDFEADDVPVIVEIIPSVQHGKVKLTGSDVLIELGIANFKLKVSGCGALAQVVGIAYDLFKDKVVNTLRAKLESMARDELLEALEDLLADFSAVSGDAGDVHVVATTQNLLIDKRAIGVDMAVDATATKRGSCMGEPRPPERLTAAPPPEFKFRGEHIGVALSKALLQNLLVEFWRAGVFCIADDETALGGVLTASAPNPPRIALIEGDEARLELTVPGVELKLSGDRPVTGTMDVRVELSLGIDLSSAVLLTDPQVTLHNVRVSTADDPTLDYAQLFARLLPPLVSQAISDAVLLPRVMDTTGGVLHDHFIYISRAATYEEHILVYAVLTKLPENDSSPPETELVETPDDGWAASTTQLIASAVDDQSPSPLLRYSWRVDGGAWADPALRARRTFELPGGRHTLEVVAVDLNGNVDKTPATTTFEVDDKAPTLTITERPPEDVRDSQFVVKYEVADDRTPEAEIKVHVTFARPVEHPDPDELTQLQDVVTELDTLKLYALGPGLHILTLVAEDRVGNRSLPVQALFEAVAIGVVPVEVEPEPPLNGDGCCAIQRGPTRGMLTALPGLMLLALHAFVRRRRRRGPAQQRRRRAR